MDEATAERNRRRRIDRRGQGLALQEMSARRQVLTSDHAAGVRNRGLWAIHHMGLLAANRGGDVAATLLRWRSWAERNQA
jgi:hypothetical protein